MKKNPSHPIAILLLVCASPFMGGSVQLAVAQSKPIEETVGHSDVQALDLTDAQKRAISGGSKHFGIAATDVRYEPSR